jgi:hypothetical protein
LLGRSDATDNEEDDETDEDQPTDVSSHAMPSNITMSPATSLRQTVVEVFDHQGKTRQTNIRSAKEAKKPRKYRWPHVQLAWAATVLMVFLAASLHRDW